MSLQPEKEMILIAINEKLEKEGKTAYWLAQQTGIHHTTLAQIRNNKNGAINLEFLDRICDVLQCEPGEIMRRVSGPAAKRKTAKKGSAK